MKKLFTIILLIYCSQIKAQLLWEETFDNYNIGNLGTDYDGNIPGQGNWLTKVVFNEGKSNQFTTIAAEQGKGKVLRIDGPIPKGTAINDALNIRVVKEIEQYINKRTTGNNVIKYEFDFYTGSRHSNLDIGKGNGILLTYVKDNNIIPNNVLLDYSLRLKSGKIDTSHLDGDTFVSLNNTNLSPVFPENTWVTFTAYIDFDNRKIYHETSYFKNIVAVGGFLKNSTSTNLIEDYKPKYFYFFYYQDYRSVKSVNMLDNIKLTAL